jgi:hypothetical protein
MLDPLYFFKTKAFSNLNSCSIPYWVRGLFSIGVGVIHLLFCSFYQTGFLLMQRFLVFWAMNSQQIRRISKVYLLLNTLYLIPYFSYGSLISPKICYTLKHIMYANINKLYVFTYKIVYLHSTISKSI